MRKLTKEVFMSRLKKNGTCLEWQGKLNSSGYGVAGHRVNVKLENGAHRVSFILNKGLIPKNINVCHTCDNKLCCNPEHLFLGNDSVNMRDCRDKGRINSQKIDANDAKLIKKALDQGYNASHIAFFFNMTRTNIYCIKLGQTWQ